MWRVALLKLLKWDAYRSKNLDSEGRAAGDVHKVVYEYHVPAVANENLATKIINNVPFMAGVVCCS